MRSNGSHKFTFLNKFSSFGQAVDAGSVLAPWVNERRLPYPYRMTVIATRDCNSRCQMCNIWRQKGLPQLSLEQYRHIFERNDWWFIRSITLTGGEPTMRQDLPQVFEVIARGCPHLEHAYLATSALNTRRTLDYVEQVLTWATSNLPGLSTFQVQVSLDGVGELHDEIRGIKGFFQRVQDTLEGLWALQTRFPILGLRLSTVVLPENLARILQVRQFATQRNLPIHFSPAVVSSEFYENAQQASDLTLDAQSGQSIESLFEELADLDTSGMQFHYRDIARMFRGAERSRRCMMGFYDWVLESDARVFACVNCESYCFGNLLETPFEALWFGPQAYQARRSLRQNCCPSCPSPCHAPPINGWELARLKLGGRLAQLKNRVAGRQT